MTYENHPVKPKRPYRMGDVKQCFGQTADGIILQWYNKGLISCGIEPRGSQSQFAFSFSEIIHVGVVIDLVRFGRTNSKEDAELSDYHLVQPTGLHQLHKEAVYKLTQADRLIALYEKYSYDLCYVFQTEVISIPQAGKRNKREISVSKGHLMTSLQCPSWVIPWVMGQARGGSIFIINLFEYVTKASRVLGIRNPWRRSLNADICEDIIVLTHWMTDKLSEI